MTNNRQGQGQGRISVAIIYQCLLNVRQVSYVSDMKEIELL